MVRLCTFNSYKFCERQSKHPAAAPWIPDDVSSRCLSCDKEFSCLLRRHHCRACGALVCTSCSGRFEFLPQYGYSLRRAVRVCKACAAKKKAVVDLEKEMFILCKKSQFRRRAKQDSGGFLVDFAAKLRLSKSTEGFSENLLQHCIRVFEKYFMSVYLPLVNEIEVMLSEMGISASPLETEEELDELLERAMNLLRSWKNLENDIPRASAKAFLGKVELLEKWRHPWEIEQIQEKSIGLPRVVSSPCLSEAQLSFHRHGVAKDYHTWSKGVVGKYYGRRSSSSSFMSDLKVSHKEAPPPSPRIRRTQSHDEYGIVSVN